MKTVSTTMACQLKLLLLTILVATTAAQWETDARKRALTRSLGTAAKKMIDYIQQHSGEYDEWLVKTVQDLRVSDGFTSIRVPDNVLELWSVMSEGPQHMERRIDELTPHNIVMPEEEKLLCAIVTRYVWEKLQRDQYMYDATNDSLTLIFKLTYEELFPPYLAMSEYLSQGRKGKSVDTNFIAEGDPNADADAAVDVDGNVEENPNSNPNENPDTNPDELKEDELFSDI